MWRRPKETVVRKVDQMEGSPIARGKEKPRKIIDEIIKRDLDINGLNINMIYKRISIASSNSYS